MLSPSLASMNWVIPSSKFRAILCGMRLLHLQSSSDMVNVDDVVDVVVLQNHLFGFDQGALTCSFERVEGSSEIGVDDFVTVAEGQPVEAQFDLAVGPGEDFDIRYIVRRPRLGGAGARPFGLDAEDAVLEAAATSIVDQGNFRLRVFDETVIVVPGRHPEAR